MRGADPVRRFFLRWSGLGLLGVLLLPFAVSSGFGFVWLLERGWLPAFLGATVLLMLLVRGAQALALYRRRPAAPDPNPGCAPSLAAHRSRPRRAPHPDWSAHDAAAFAAACDLAQAQLAGPVAWQDMPARALAVVEHVVATLSDGRRGALDFTLPEALLLVDRVALRYRGFLRRNVPFSDQLSVRAMFWAWQRRERAQAAWESGYMVWRGVRLLWNPAVGVLREIERIATAGLQARLTDHVQRDAQLALLEEVAVAAVDLYSGRLRFSDVELMELDLPSAADDRKRMAPPHDPVRVVVVGQISVGKSSLVNALLRSGAAETDAAPSTNTVTIHPLELDGIALHLVDTPGLDGGRAIRARLLEQMLAADMVLWVLRANRSGRGDDVALMAAFRAALDRAPARRAPPVIAAASAVDALLPGWPFPEHRLPDAAADRLGQAMAAIGEDLDLMPVPFSLVPVAWNVAALEAALTAALPEALMVQRNRRRLEATGRRRALAQNLSRAARGARAGLGFITERWRRGGQGTPGPERSEDR